MSKIRIVVRPLDLPLAPRQAMARLRRRGRYALLESALAMPGQGEWSYIAGPATAELYTDAAGTHLRCAGEVTRTWSDPFEALKAVVGDGVVDVDGELPEGMNFIGGWVGALGYDLVRYLDDLPGQWWMRVDHVLAFDHRTGQWWHAALDGQPHPHEAALRAASVREPWRTMPARSLTSRADFESRVREIRDAIHRGEVLQVNLSRREDLRFEGDPWSLYEDLVAAHPAPFAAFLEGPGFALASCSPERFLQRTGQRVQARPIKGTVQRGADAAEDAARREWLARSAKNRAENVMIVDLMRNDLGRVAATGSVRVTELCALEPYASVWQMVSTIEAQLRDDCSTAALLRACWPPGSMTGAPKVQAMRMIEAFEPVRRGFYAGSIGYLDWRGNMDLSVVIRSVVVANGCAMLQLGAGIVADSDPPSEWWETVAKGRHMLGVLAPSADRSVVRAST